MPTTPGRGDGARDTRHDFEGDARRRERLRLLTPAAEHAGVAAFETNDVVARGRPPDQQVVDFDLCRPLAGAALAHVD
jgi:hypothetical protein